MDIGIKRIIDEKKTKQKLSRYLPEGEEIEDDQQLLDLHSAYNKVSWECIHEIETRAREAFLELLAPEMEEEISLLLPSEPRKISWRSLKKEKKDFLKKLYLRSLEEDIPREQIAEDFRAYLLKGRKKFEVLKE